MLDRLSIRAKLTAAFAAAMLTLLALGAAFTYFRVQSDLNETIDEGLFTRARSLEFVVDRFRGRKLPPAHAELFAGEELYYDVAVADRDRAKKLNSKVSRIDPELADQVLESGIDSFFNDRDYRCLAHPDDSGNLVALIVVCTSTEDRDETLAGLRYTFLVGGPIALLLASWFGYLVSGRALAPVARMRVRASEITLQRSGERLPLPRAEDEIHELGSTLNTMLDRIEASLEREREFVADAGHELRTPLAILRAELELAEREGRSPEELRAAIASAAEETDRLSQLAEDLLVIARSDQGRLPIKREPVELGELLERVRKRFAQRAADAGRGLSIDSPGGARADLDPLRMEQALGNLVDNALRHGAGDIEMTAATDGGRAVFEVRDHGPGLPNGFSERAFERFSRADEGRTGGGAGLGLAIVEAIVKAHGGVARIDGAGVVLTVPA